MSGVRQLRVVVTADDYEAAVAFTAATCNVPEPPTRASS